jgi:hypothetical protein
MRRRTPRRRDSGNPLPARLIPEYKPVLLSGDGRCRDLIGTAERRKHAKFGRYCGGIHRESALLPAAFLHARLT